MTPSMAEMDGVFREQEIQARLGEVARKTETVKASVDGKSVDVVRPRTEPALPAAALARYADFAPGDQLTITLGQELYSPIKYFTFTVGPFAATVTVRPNESGADAAMRCYRVLLELNEAEFNIAWQRHRDRIAKMPKARD